MDGQPGLAAIFLAVRPDAGDSADLGHLLAGLHAAGRERWPRVPLEPALFVHHLARHSPAQPALGLSGLWIEDLYLACACAHGIAPALRALEDGYLRQVAERLSRRGDPAFADEVMQALRQRLLVADEGPPRIAEYSGRGGLLSYLRAAAYNLARDRHRQAAGAPIADDGRLAEALAPAADPVVELADGRYRQELQRAVRESLLALPVDQRNILRLHYLDGLVLDQIAAVLGIHRSSAYRRLADAREAVRRSWHRLLTERLRLTPAELDSLAGVLRSRLDLSLAGALRDPAE